MLEKLFKEVLINESEAFNEMYTKLQEEKRELDIQYKSKITSLDINHIQFKKDYDDLVNYIAIAFRKYGNYIEDLICDYIHSFSQINYYLTDKFVISKIKNIIKYREIQKESDIIKQNQIKLTFDISRLSHLNADTLYYSALEAMKDLVPENCISSEYIDDTRYFPTYRRLQRNYTFPHNIETNTRCVDERLYNMFRHILNTEFMHPVNSIKEYKAAIIHY